MLTVADIVGVAPLRLQVSGGAAGIDRPVRWVHISELDDPTPWLRGGELLLTTGRPLAVDAGGYVRRLHAAGLAALGLGLGFGHDQPPAEAVATADELGFPLLVTPYDVPFIAITEAVFNRLVDDRVALLESLTELTLEDRPLRDLLDQIAARTGIALAVSDASGTTLAATEGADPSAPGARRLPVAAGGRVQAELLAVPAGRPDPQLLHHLQTVIAVELLKRQAVAETERRLAGELVEAVLSGELGARELQRRRRAFGLSGGRGLAFAVLRPGADDGHGLARLAESAATIGPAAVRDGMVAALIAADDDESAERQTGRLLERTGAVAAGVGRVRTDHLELPRSYDEALYAIEAHVPNGGPQVATFRDLGSVQLLLSVQDERGIDLFCDAVLGPLLEHDRRHGAALVPSLRAFLQGNGRWAEASAELGVHRHTLRYRMRRVQELTGRDLDDAGNRLELWLALHALDLRRRSPAAEPEPAPV
jgi:purine catabolism regulator